MITFRELTSVFYPLPALACWAWVVEIRFG